MSKNDLKRRALMREVCQQNSSLTLSEAADVADSLLAKGITSIFETPKNDEAQKAAYVLSRPDRFEQV